MGEEGPARRPSRLTSVEETKCRRTDLLICALIFVADKLQAALVPLLPRFAHELGLSDVETGSLLAAATLATVVIRVPMGLLSDRLAAKLSRSVPPSSSGRRRSRRPSLRLRHALAGRLLFGIGFGAAWTAGGVVVSQASNARRAIALGRISSAAGIRALHCPMLAGNMAESVRIAAPFLAIGPSRSASAHCWRSPRAACRSPMVGVALEALRAAGADAGWRARCS